MNAPCWDGLLIMQCWSGIGPRSAASFSVSKARQETRILDFWSDFQHVFYHDCLKFLWQGEGFEYFGGFDRNPQTPPCIRHSPKTFNTQYSHIGAQCCHEVLSLLDENLIFLWILATCTHWPLTDLEQSNMKVQKHTHVCPETKCSFVFLYYSCLVDTSCFTTFHWPPR